MKTQIFHFAGYGSALMAITSALARAETGARIKVRFKGNVRPQGTVRITADSQEKLAAARDRFLLRGVTLT